MKRGSVFVVIAASLLLAGSQLETVFAASDTGTNITTSPISTSLTGKPGQSITTTLEMENNESSPIPIQVQLEKFRADGTNGQAQIMAGTASDVFLSWAHLSRTSFIAQPGAWSPVKLTINLPKTASLGYYYAVIFKPQTTLLPGQKTSNNIKSGNAILILVDANSGNAHPKLAVASFTATKKLYEYLPAEFSVEIHNTGNIYLPPAGDIYISRSSTGNDPITTIPINPNIGNVLPGTSRIFQQAWSNGFPVFVPKTVNGQKVTDKKGRVIEQLQWNFSQADKLRFGKYYAKMVMVYNNGLIDVPVDATLSFWVIPWKLLTIVVLVLVLVAVGLFVSGRKVAARAVRLTQKVRKR
jgi:hypothetical protein